MTAPPDSFTVLTTKGPLATKKITAIQGWPPRIEDYGRAQRFTFVEWAVSTFDEMAEVLEDLQSRSRSFVVRGKPAAGIDRGNSPRRLRPRGDEPATLIAQPRFCLPLDMDSVLCPASVDPVWEPDRVVEHVVGLLPEEFHGVSTFWSFTSGHGIKPGIRIRLWFWLDRPLSDAEIKIWLAKPIAARLIDPAIFNAGQAIYTAAPIFVGVPDPVPYRCGVWRGYDDAVEVPVIERPQRVTNGASGTSPGNDGGGYTAYRAQIGDGEGRGGFYGPLKAAIGAFIAEAGADADTAWLRADLERAIREAPRDLAVHDDSYIEARVADRDPWIAWTLAQEREKEAGEAAAEVCEPTCPPPRGSIGDARDALAAAMDRFATAALAWPPPAAPVAPDAQGVAAILDQVIGGAPPAHGVIAEFGAGKTTAFCQRVVPPVIAAGRRFVLAAPRHRLGDEIVRTIPAGISARVFRGREALDPADPAGRTRMCRDLERVKEIEFALGNASTLACKSSRGECPFFNSCGYQQQRRQQPDGWVVPHPLLFRPRPEFITCDVLGIDESFHNAALHGVDKDKPVVLAIDLLIDGDRTIPGDDDAARDATNDLISLSARVHAVLTAQRDGWLPRSAFEKAGIAARDAERAHGSEWKRKREIAVYPGMPAKQYKAACGAVAKHNQAVARLGRFWRLLEWTLDSPGERSAWAELRREEDDEGLARTVVRLSWRDDIDPSWRAPTMVLDATMPVEIVRLFFPQMEEPVVASAAMPHTYVRQITDRPMSAAMLTETDTASERRNQSRRNNIERLRRISEVRAATTRGRVLEVMQLKVEAALKAGPLPANVETAHFNDVAGENAWSDVAALAVTGRTLPSPRDMERSARALFGADVFEIPADADGSVRYQRVPLGIRMRDGTGRRVEGDRHPDRRVEAVRWRACEGELLHTIGRGRGVNRTADDPLAIDIQTDVCLPTEIDEVVTWRGLQPTNVETMRARGALPTAYRDMAAAYPDLFDTREAAKKAIERENWGQTSMSKYLIDKCPQFLALAYRRTGSRGPAPRLLFDPARIADPAAWLAAHIGDVVILGEPEQPVADAPPVDQPAAAEPEPPVDAPIAAGCPADGVDWAAAMRSFELGCAPDRGIIPHTSGPAADALICAGIGWDADEDAVPPFDPVEPPTPPPGPFSAEWEARHAAE